MSAGGNWANDPRERLMRNRLRDSLFGTSKVPIRIDRYVIVDELGAGGLGVVYRAYDPKLDRKVALKVIRPERTPADDSAARMEREAQAMARLAHPNVVVVHDTGYHAGGVFIAMECLNGTRLDHWSRERQSDWKAIRDVVCDAGRGLAAAHAAGLVHRDFKPANVLVTTETVAKVLDFGLAQASASSPVSTTAGPVTCAPGILTETGVVMGTPAFMSPEQFEGQTDPRSDQWSFCISAWQCFVGERPYVTSEVDELRMLIRTAPPDVPTQASAPGWVFRVLRRGLSPNPQDRYPSMDALLSALERDKRSRRRQRFGLLGAVVLSASLGATAMALFEPTPSAQVVSEVDALEAQAREAARRGHFVFPPSTDRSAQTSLLLVLALEQLEGDGGELASARATTLRKELAAKLVELGDTYADLEGAEAFAADYYASALLFDPEEPRARARAGLTPGELAALRKHASDGSFTDAELAGADVLAELAQEPKEGRAQRLAKVKTTRRAVAQPPAAPSPRPADPPAAADVDPTPSEASSPRSPRDAGRGAKQEVKRGQALLRQGKRKAAAQAFHRALNLDPKNAAALRQLGALAFDRGAYQSAVDYGKKATRAAPRSSAAHMELGDALFKVHRYDAARDAYVTARRLGASGAAKAIERVDARLGR